MNSPCLNKVIALPIVFCMKCFSLRNCLHSVIKRTPFKLSFLFDCVSRVNSITSCFIFISYSSSLLFSLLDNFSAKWRFSFVIVSSDDVSVIGISHASALWMIDDVRPFCAMWLLITDLPATYKCAMQNGTSVMNAKHHWMKCWSTLFWLHQFSFDHTVSLLIKLFSFDYTV